MEEQNTDIYTETEQVELSNQTTNIRKAVIPLFEALLQKIEKQPVDRSVKTIEAVIAVLTEKLGELKETGIRQVEIVNQKQPIINVVEKQIEFPEIQQITGQVEVKKIDNLQKAIDNLTEVIIAKKTPKFPYKKDERIPVKIMEMPVVESGGTEKVKDVTVNNKFNTNNVDNEVSTAGIVYVCKEDKDGAWLIKKINLTTLEILYATIVNNPTITTYNNAYTNRTTLTYSINSGTL